MESRVCFGLKKDTTVSENVENDGFCRPLCQEMPEIGHGSGGWPLSGAVIV